MASLPLDLILLYGASGTGAGLVVGMGQGMRYANGTGKNQNQFPIPFKVRAMMTDTATGGDATIQVQSCNDNSTWGTQFTFHLVIPAAAPFAKGWDFTFKLVSAQFFRLNVSALSGTTAPVINAYGTFLGFGT